VNAVDRRAAPLAKIGIQNIDGDGAETLPFGFGGLLFIFCSGAFIGKDGTIDLSGLDGMPGNSGGNGSLSNRGSQSGGGGGDGGAGGEAGRLLVVSNAILTQYSVNCAGG